MVMAAFGLFVITSAFYATGQLQGVQTGYENVVKGPAQAALLLAVANRGRYEAVCDAAGNHITDHYFTSWMCRNA